MNNKLVKENLLVQSPIHYVYDVEIKIFPTIRFISSALRPIFRGTVGLGRLKNRYLSFEVQKELHDNTRGTFHLKKAIGQRSYLNSSNSFDKRLASTIQKGSLLDFIL